MTIYDAVKELCYGRGMSIRKLEMEIGLGNGTIGKWNDKTQRRPSTATLSLVANYFGKDMEYFLNKEMEDDDDDEFNSVLKETDTGEDAVHVLERDGIM